MPAELFLDTNIFIYHLDGTDRPKHEKAEQLVRDALATGSGCISYQVVQECLNVVLQKARVPLDAGEAREGPDDDDDVGLGPAAVRIGHRLLGLRLLGPEDVPERGPGEDELADGQADEERGGPEDLVRKRNEEPGEDSEHGGDDQDHTGPLHGLTIGPPRASAAPSRRCPSRVCRGAAFRG